MRGTLVMIGECFRMSLSNIRGAKVRSFLTVLGILIGVMAVIALITTVNGVTGSISDSFLSMGAGTLMVSVTGSDLKTGMTTADLEALTQLEEVEGITPTVNISSARISRGGKYESRISVSGKNAYYFLTNPEVVLRGRMLNIVDERNMSAVCLIDDEMIESFFYGVDPLGERLYVNGIPFLVVGTFSADSTESIASIFSGSPNILIPYTTAMKMNNASDVTSFTVYMAEGVTSDEASEAVEGAMDAMFSYEEDTFTITTMDAIEETMETMTGMMTTLLAGIASIALLVGGIGIMNMMLTTVTERTTEIGLKKALGARQWQIQLQFLIESFLLSLIGGIAGILLGLGLSLALSNVMGTSFRVNMDAIALGFGFSAAIGIVFGWAPARKASRLNPIDALRAM
ncbi:MAG: ABC transporter permease [Clostridia bacterium]|nr:ABC transporter permease [Clostridia bacterium]